MERSVLEFYCESCEEKYTGMINEICQVGVRYRASCPYCNNSNNYNLMGAAINMSNCINAVDVYKD
ncbi:hypothetical protein [Photobacterium damselae]|uniref:hypothetical protein n=1 Tax=Photobacterium damselae TaxID=38293 RepID=UPI0012AE6996|nr:hypothetical protein [Photobacterium damselae]